MAAINIRRFHSIHDAENFLQGGIRLPFQMKGDERVYGLDTKTLVFTTPAGTATFTDPSNAGLRLDEIIAEILTVSGLAVRRYDRVLYIVQAAPTTGVVLDGASSTAAAILGFPAASVSGIKYAAPSGAAPRLISFEVTGAMDGFVVVTEE